ncbi:ATP-binding protein [Gemella cuniculi]|uniref:ATP-binding protein n=1 Tax=Gemella cuniculi TaxID=150240 RepID=UPI000429AAC6|nr:ATP-binding protein [Gemella cuniculi]
MKKKKSTLLKLMFLMMTLVIISLLVTTIFMRYYIKTREDEIIREKIQSTARLIANNSDVKKVVEKRENNELFQNYVNNAMKETGTDFIVVMDKDFIRYSHPTTDLIGKKFSNLKDAGETFTTGEHYSRETGTLGEGVRFFTVIKDDYGNNIGVVCVGYTKRTVESQLLKVQCNLFISLFIGLGVAIFLATVFNKQLKKILLNREPEEIAQSFIEKELISDHVSEGIIGIDLNKKIIVINSSANNLLKKAKFHFKLEMEKTLDEDIYELLFKNILEDQKSVLDEQIILNNVDVLLNKNPIYYNGKLYGAVVTLRDQSEMKQLITELSGTEKYNDSLREQSHHFMNKLHVLQGLIELKSYDDVEKYITYLKDDYHEKIGHITENIKVPSIAGFLLAKSREAKKKNIKLVVDNDSIIYQQRGLENIFNELLIILGVLVDNSVDALEKRENRKIIVYLFLNLDEKVLLCSVEDNGEGISKENKNNIFKRGYSTKGINRGYGLEAVETIVTKYDGLINVESEEEKGTKITIEIPI